MKLVVSLMTHLISLLVIYLMMMQDLGEMEWNEMQIQLKKLMLMMTIKKMQMYQIEKEEQEIGFQKEPKKKTSQENDVNERLTLISCLQEVCFPLTHSLLADDS